jgi:DNA-binding GntR family transcriptional regulator
MTETVKANFGGKAAANLTRAALPRVDRNTLGDEIVAHLREAICTGQLKPGERLVESAIAESMRVSRGPVRDALRQLEIEGLVTSELNRGTFVAHLTPHDIEEIYSLRMELETLAIRWLVRHGSAADLDKMRAIVDLMSNAAAANLSAQEAADLDLSFHDAIYESCGHRRARAVWDSLRPQIVTFLRARNTRRADYNGIMAPFHQSILDALIARDEEKAVEYIRDHISSSYEALKGELGN